MVAEPLDVDRGLGHTVAVLRSKRLTEVGCGFNLK